MTRESDRDAKRFEPEAPDAARRDVDAEGGRPFAADPGSDRSRAESVPGAPPAESGPPAAADLDGSPDDRETDGVADGEEHRLDRGYVAVQRITGSILTLVVAVSGLVAVVPVIFLGRMSGTVNGLMLLAWLSLVAFLGVSALWWPAVRYRHTWYSLDDRELRIRRGVLWQTVTSLPRARVQHTDVSQGPLERMFELATLVIYTAGTQHASVALAGLPHDRASRMRDRLVDAGSDDAV